MQNFTKEDFLKSGISKITIDNYLNDSYLTDTPDYWQLKYPELNENKPTDYYNMRLKNPTDSKYIKPKDMCSRLFRPLALNPYILNNPNDYLIITEGEKKAIKAVQEGFNCIALAGVWAWKKTPKEKEENEFCADIIPDLSNLDFKGKTIFLCYDNDMWSKSQVKQALYHFSAYLVAEKQAIVKIIKLPQEDNKLGLDDYLIRYNKNNFQELLNNAEELNLQKYKIYYLINQTLQ